MSLNNGIDEIDWVSFGNKDAKVVGYLFISQSYEMIDYLELFPYKI
jgi:hypothetical protein